MTGMGLLRNSKSNHKATNKTALLHPPDDYSVGRRRNIEVERSGWNRYRDFLIDGERQIELR